MEILPHELIAAIGDRLVPKWRCRLFICVKLWYSECYMNTDNKYLLIWYGKISPSLAYINNIKHKVLSERLVSLSKRAVKLNNNKHKVYSFYGSYRIRRTNEHFCCEVISPYTKYEYIDHCKTMHMDEYKHYRACDDYIIIQSLYTIFKLKQTNKYKILRVLWTLSYRIDHPLFLKLAIAFGKDIYIALRELIISMNIN